MRTGIRKINLYKFLLSSAMFTILAFENKTRHVKPLVLTQNADCPRLSLTALFFVDKIAG